MMAPKLALFEAEPLDALVDTATRERETSISPLSPSHRAFASATAKRLTLPSRTVLIKLDVRIAALAFGIAIWLCLIGTDLLAPHGSEMLFPLTPITFSLSLLGHIIYDLSIGFLYPIFVPNGKGLT